MTVETGSETSQKLSPSESQREQTNLDCRYGAIGILAVAAAVRYAGHDKGAAPVAPRIDQRFVEFAI